MSQCYKVVAIVAYEGVAKSRSRTNRTAWGPSSFKAPAAHNRKNPERLLARPSAGASGALVRAASISYGVAPADKEARRMREMIQELSLKLDALLAKE